MENNNVEVVVEKRNFIQKLGSGISKAGDKIQDFTKKHEVGIKRAKAAATVIGGAAVLGLIIGGKKKSKVDEIECQDWKEVPDPEEEYLDELEATESEVEESEKEETEEE